MKQSPYRWCLVAVLGTGLFLLFGVGCTREEPVPSRESPAVPLTILYTGNVNGELERCGCSEKQMGGVARRKTVIDGFRSQTTLLLDAGDTFFGSFEGLPGSPEFYRVKSESMVRSMNMMGYDAALLGDYDFALGASLVLGLMKDADFPFLCTNLNGPDGAPVGEAYRIIEKGVLRVAVVGFLDAHVVTDRYRQALGDLTIEDPFEAARRVLPELVSQSDLVVALLHFNVTEVGKFLDAFPQIHVAIAGHSRGDGTPERVASSIVVYGSDLGKEVGRLDLTVRPGEGVVETRGTLIPVSEETALDEGADREVSRFHQIVREKKFSEDIFFRSDSPPEEKYLGADHCAPCHPQFFQRWSRTPHAHAFDTLKAKGYEYNPECVGCHVVGYRSRGGFLGEEKTPDLMGVQCESCHGSGEGHPSRSPMNKGVPEDICRACHNEIHSPGFAVPLYYERADQCTEP